MPARLTRRAFLQTGAATGAGATLPAPRAGEAEMQAGSLAQSPATAMAISLLVNEVAHALRVEPRSTLAEVLRGPLGLSGTKIACDRGSCSACTVWVDGHPVCSCMLLAVEAAGHRVTTIEGLARGDTLHPVQEAFIANDAMQCGFCTPGMAMSCAALLARQAEPSVADVQAAIAGHLCRCGTYPHVVDATLAAAKAIKG